MSRILLTFCLLVLLFGLDNPADRVMAGDAPRPADTEKVCTEVARLLAELDDDEFDVRHRAAADMEKLIARRELGPILSAEFQKVLLQPDISFEVRWHVKRWAARLPEATPKSPKSVSPEQLDRVLRQLEDDSYAVRQGAARRLEWLASQDGLLPTVKKAIEARLKATSDAEVADRLRKLLELTRPAMVAECWQGRRHLTEQHLLVGVPSLVEGAKRPSHFDRIDDKVAHCVSGSSLSPGDYPVGVAFPHPKTEGAFFHLVNLPTPRRRLAYAEYVKKDQAERLRHISRRTLDRFLEEKRSLTEPELVMLGQLDPKEVSLFSGKFLAVVEDELLPTTGRSRFGGRPSRHAMLCGWLACFGTKEAVPGLLKAIDEGRFLPPTSEARYRLHLIAALSIAGRDPWPTVDNWLADQVGHTDLLVEQRTNGPEFGATAAALLLKRHRKTGATFGLRQVPDAQLRALRVDGHRFVSDDSPKKVLDWWKRDRDK